MKLRQLLAGVAPLGASLDPEMEISGISYDTRTLRPGEVFFALPGSRTDGRRFLKEALSGALPWLCARERPVRRDPG